MRKYRSQRVTSTWRGDSNGNYLRQKLFSIPRVPRSFSSTVGEKLNPLLAFASLHTHIMSSGPAVRGVALAKGPNTRAGRSGWPGSGGLENLSANDFHEFQLNGSDNEKGNEAEFLTDMREGEHRGASRPPVSPNPSKTKVPLSKTPAF